jgi:hypothetical protein
MSEKVNKKYFDEWREIAFYNYVKDYIIKKKVSPNFTGLYGYNITKDSRIDFDDKKRLESIIDVRKMTKLYIIKSGSNKKLLITNINNSTCNKNNDSREELMSYRGKVIVALTESYNYNLLQWTSIEYKLTDMNSKRPINSGYKTANLWYSVLFQIMAAINVMQKKGIVINNFRIDRNVFIKDIAPGGNVTQYWKYKIDGIDYYVPNYGYLVLIDSNYRDFDVELNDNEIVSMSRERKLDGTFIDPEYDNQKIKEKTYEMLKNVINTNIFNDDFIKNGGISPPQEILTLLTNIQNDIESMASYDISYYIRRHMTMYMNNRIGTLLKMDEINNIKHGGMKQFRKGEIVVTKDTEGNDIFVLHIKTHSNGISNIITKTNVYNDNTTNFIEKEVNISSLTGYSYSEPLKQNFNMNKMNLSEDGIIETYIC